MRQRGLLIVAVIVILLGAIGWFILTNLPQKVHIDYATSQVKPTVSIYESSEHAHESESEDYSDETPIKTLRGSEEISLKKGSYVALVTEEGFASNEIPFQVKGETSVIIPIEYTDEALSKLLEENLSTLHGVVRSGAKVPANYQIDTGKLLSLGDWYITTLVDISASEDAASYSDTYRVVVGKKDGQWVLVTPTPKLLHNTKDSPTIPASVIDAANNL